MITTVSGIGWFSVSQISQFCNIFPSIFQQNENFQQNEENEENEGNEENEENEGKDRGK